MSQYLALALNIMLFSIMLGMGATLELNNFRETFKNPRPFLIGMLSQFGFLPFFGFMIALALNLSPVMSLGLLMIACTPGGSTSNLYTYYSKGDLALSISMTVASSIAAIIMMPLLLSVYSSIIGINEEILVPYMKIVTLLLMLMIPVSMGMIIRRFSEKWARVIEKTGAYLGIIAIVVIFIIPLVSNKKMFQVPFGVFLSPALIAGCGMLFGYLLSRWSKLSIAQSKTVSLETGIQNAVLTIGIIAASFEGDILKDLLVIPILYTFFIPLFSVLVSFVVFRKLIPSN